MIDLTQLLKNTLTPEDFTRTPTSEEQAEAEALYNAMREAEASEAEEPFPSYLMRVGAELVSSGDMTYAELLELCEDLEKLDKLDPDDL
jgi:hypothetical protein